MSDKTVQTGKFSTLRSIFWPIYWSEFKKVFLMGALLFCMLFEYTTVRILKDAFVVGSSGADLIPFLKTFLILPAAAGYVWLYAWLSRNFNYKTVFYVITGGFGLFFLFFGNVLYPHADMIHMSADRLTYLCTTYPRFANIIRLRGLIGYSLFYVLAELWGTIGITQMFWEFANLITTTEESSRFYITFQSIANYALIIAGWTVLNMFTEKTSNGMLAVSKVRTSCNLVFMFTVISFVLYYILNTMPDVKNNAKIAEGKKQKEKPGFLASAKIIAKSRYLIYIALLLIAYGASINLIEVTWKGVMKQYSVASGVSYVGLQSKTFMYTGAAAIVISTFGKSIIKSCGWRFTALVTPIGMLISGLIFFASVIFPNSLNFFISHLGLTSLYVGTMIGTAQNVFAKSTKYVLFDVTKEMAYIPLDDTMKKEGKAAVEVLGGKGGKIFGSVLQIILSFITGISSARFLELSPYLAIILTMICVVWIAIVNLLAHDYEKLIASKK